MPTTQEIIEKMKRVIESSSIEQKPIVDRVLTIYFKKIKVHPYYKNEIAKSVITQYTAKFKCCFVPKYKPICIKL